MRSPRPERCCCGATCPTAAANRAHRGPQVAHPKRTRPPPAPPHPSTTDLSPRSRHPRRVRFRRARLRGHMDARPRDDARPTDVRVQRDACCLHRAGLRLVRHSPRTVVTRIRRPGAWLGIAMIATRGRCAGVAARVDRPPAYDRRRRRPGRRQLHIRVRAAGRPRHRPATADDHRAWGHVSARDRADGISA